METALLYNADILVQLYACIGTWRYSGHFPAKVYSNSNALFIWLAPIGTFLLVSLSQRITHHSDGNNMMDMSYLSLLVLVLTADGIFLLVRSILTVLARIIPPRQQNQSIILRWHRQWTFLLLLAGAMTSMAICGVQLGESWAWSRPQAVLSLLSIVAVYVVGLYLVTELPIDGNVTCSIFVERQIDFVTWIWLVVPFLSFGNLVMIPERLTAWTLPLSLLPIASRLAFTAAYTTSACSNGDEDIFSRKLPVWSSVNSVLRAVVAVLGCWRVAGAASSLYYGEDVLHPIAQLAVIFSIWDIAEMALIASRH